MSRQVLFGLEALTLLDFGKINALFKSEVARVVADCLDRPTEDKARVVQLKFLFAPSPDSPGQSDCHNVLVEVEVTSGLPKMRTRIFAMSPNKRGELRFHPDRDDDPDGNTLYDEDGKRQDGTE